MNIAIEIPDDIGRVLAARAGGVSRAVLEAVRRRSVSLWHDHVCAGTADAGIALAVRDGVLPSARRGLPRLHDG